MNIPFADERAYHLAAALLSQPGQPAPCRMDPAAREIEVDDRDMMALIERIAQGRPVPIAQFGSDCDRWMLMAAGAREAGRAFAHLSSFLLPTYGILPEATGFAALERLDASASPMQALASLATPLYNWGYRWEAPAAYRQQLLKRLGLWARLDSRQPELKLPHQASYAELLGRFKSALAAADWPAAEAVIAEMRKQHLCTAENLSYLQVQLHAQQGRWRVIWDDQTYTWLSRLPVPRAVRSALITAFHHSVLLEAEASGDLSRALDRYKDQRSRLGNLITARFQLTESPVVRVFGYQAVVARDRVALDALLALPGLDAAARICLEGLTAFLPAQPESVVTPGVRLTQAMRARDYDAAVEAAQGLETPSDRAVALLRIAARHQDAARLALAAWESLSPNEQADIEEIEPALDRYLELTLAAFPRPVPQIQNSGDWFQRAITAPDDPVLLPALDALAASADDRDWDPAMARRSARQIEGMLGEGTALITHRTIQRGIDALIDQTLSDRAFPQSHPDYRDLYQALYDSLILAGVINEETSTKLLRLAEAVLRMRPAQVESAGTDLRNWFDRPSPALEVQVLDAFDLLIEFGLARDAFAPWYRKWVEHRLDLPASVTWPRAHQEVWLALGEWIQPGQDLLLQLRQRLQATVEEAGEDPISHLPAGYRIGIFTLQRSSAERAREILLRRNPSLDVRLCLETDMNRAVEAIARNSDAAVVVTTCLSHAIFYGIGPLLQQEPIYPEARGCASIIRALEVSATRFTA